jgi:hypothetical protein
VRIKQFGATSVSLSSNRGGADAALTGGFAEINVPLKVEAREPEDAPLTAQVRFNGEQPVPGTVIEERSGKAWILFRLPQESLSEGRSLTLCALLDDAVVWERDYTVAWHGRFPSLDAA